jgi:large subunit ribosomal protein L15
VRLNELKGASGSKKARKRVGRGTGSGRGKTSGRGHKGAGARSGAKAHATYEGGQMPLQRRVPKLKGFTNPTRVEYAVVNVEVLGKYYAAGAEVTPEALYDHGLVHKGRPVKILARGELDRAIVVRAHAFSAAARAKIEAAGGRAELLG